MSIEKRSVGFLGLGRIGSRCAYSLALSGVADDLVLVDIDEKRAASEASDIGDAVAYMKHRVTVQAGDDVLLARCDLVVLTAGIVSDSKDRLSLLEGNARIADTAVDSLMRHGFDGILIVITNPCDVLARRAAVRSGLPRGRVFSTGTALDSARLIKQLALLTGVDHKVDPGLGHRRARRVPGDPLVRRNGLRPDTGRAGLTRSAVRGFARGHRRAGKKTVPGLPWTARVSPNTV